VAIIKTETNKKIEEGCGEIQSEECLFCMYKALGLIPRQSKILEKNGQKRKEHFSIN
jgi:hypothetical protein